MDERLRAGDGIWAIGDVNGVMLFTHVGKYQAKIAAQDMLGNQARADYRAVPGSCSPIRRSPPSARPRKATGTWCS